MEPEENSPASILSSQQPRYQHNNNNYNISTSSSSSAASPADLVREIEALRARTLALQRKIDSTATGMTNSIS